MSVQPLEVEDLANLEPRVRLLLRSFAVKNLNR